MDNLIRFQCPYCNQRLKAPPEYAQRRAKCTRKTCRQAVIVPGSLPPTDDIWPPVLPPTPPRPKAPVKVAKTPWLLIGGAFLGLAVLVFGVSLGVYWRAGQPTHAQETAFEEFLRTGNELVTLHGPMNSTATPTSLAVLEAKGNEAARWREEVDRIQGRRKEKLMARYAERLLTLETQLAELVVSGKVRTVSIVALEKGHWATMSHERASAKSPTPPPAKLPAPPAPIGKTPETPLPPVVKSEPAKPAPTVWDEIPDNTLATRAVVYSEAKGTMAYHGSVAVELRDSGNRGFQTTYILDAQDSLWFIAQGGLTWLGEFYPEDTVVYIDQQRRIHRVSDNVTAWVSLKGELPLYAQPNATGQPVTTIPKTAKVQFLHVNPAKDGYSKIRYGTHVGWVVNGTWDKLSFRKVAGTALVAEQPVAPKPTPRTLDDWQQSLVGEWFDGPLTLSFKANGEHSASHLATDGTNYQLSACPFTLKYEANQARFRFSLDVGRQAKSFDYIVLPETTPEVLVVQDQNSKQTHRYQRVKDKKPVAKNDPTPAPKSTDTQAPRNLDEWQKFLVGEWADSQFTLTFKADGDHSAYYFINNSDGLKTGTESFTLKYTTGQARFRFPVGFGLQAQTYDLAILPETTATTLVVQDLNSKKTLRLQRRTATKPTTKSEPPPKPVAKATPGQPHLSDLTITKTTSNPPSVEFTVKLDLQGGELLEAWASVGVKDCGPVLKTFAGALYEGLLSVNGIDFGNPAPDLKAQRVVMKPSPQGGNLFDCTVRYPKLILDNPDTEFGIVVAVRTKEKVLKSNAAIVFVNLKTGVVRP